MVGIVYLDANATQPIRPAAQGAVAGALGVAGNPSSVHGAGRAARRVLEDARESIAACFGARAQDLVFTSGGTEADAAAIMAMRAGRRLIVSAIEHDAVRSAAPDAIVLPVDRDGVVDLMALEALLRDGGPGDGQAGNGQAGKGQAGNGGPALVCLMLANNETGVIQPVARAASLCREFGALLHVDAVQAAGRMAVRLDEIGAHSMAISSHKLGGPAGIGALLLAPDAPFGGPLIGGGGQERGRRGGTQPVALAAGFAAAAQACVAEDPKRPGASLAPLRDAAEQAAVACGAIVCGGSVERLPNTTCLALPGAAAAVQVMALDLEGIAVSAGAACSSGKVKTSHVLEAMGLGRLAGEAIRVSLPWNATRADIDAFAAAYQRVAERLASAERSSATLASALASRAA